MRQDEPFDVEHVPGADARVRLVVDDVIAQELAPLDAVLAQGTPEVMGNRIGELVSDEVLEGLVHRADKVRVAGEPAAPGEGPDRRVLAHRSDAETQRTPQR